MGEILCMILFLTRVERGREKSKRVSIYPGLSRYVRVRFAPLLRHRCPNACTRVLLYAKGHNPMAKALLARFLSILSYHSAVSDQMYFENLVASTSSKGEHNVVSTLCRSIPIQASCSHQYS
jgi:hypothetical protein